MKKKKIKALVVAIFLTVITANSTFAIKMGFSSGEVRANSKAESAYMALAESEDSTSTQISALSEIVMGADDSAKELVVPTDSKKKGDKEEKSETREQIIERLVADVESGKAGTGEARRKYLGEYYNEVQSIINKEYADIEKTSNNTNNSSGAKITATGNKATYQAYAHDLLKNQYHWSDYDWDCLVKLWERESNWNPNATNKSSGAHGIPQSLPASKMASYGDDYMTNYQTQIKWGLNYIKQRYGTPAKAWAHSEKTGWY